MAVIDFKRHFAVIDRFDCTRHQWIIKTAGDASTSSCQRTHAPDEITVSQRCKKLCVGIRGGERCSEGHIGAQIVLISLRRVGSS